MPVGYELFRKDRPMEFYQLRYFIAAAEELGITRASRRLNVTQPALSRQIAALEEELGVALFDRIKQRIHLTDAGRFFLTRARQIVCDAATSAQQVREQFGSARRTLRLGFLTPFLDDLVVPAVKAFRQRHPTTQVALFELSPRAQLDRLRNDELDLAVLGNVATDDHAVFEVHAIMRSRMAAILPVDHALSARRSVALRELAGEVFVSLSDLLFPGRRDFLRAICARQGFVPKIGFECDSLPLLLGAVAAGEGVALLPRHSEKLPHGGCVYVTLKSPISHAETFLVRRRGPVAAGIAALSGEIEACAAAVSGPVEGE